MTISSPLLSSYPISSHLILSVVYFHIRFYPPQISSHIIFSHDFLFWSNLVFLSTFYLI